MELTDKADTTGKVNPGYPCAFIAHGGCSYRESVADEGVLVLRARSKAAMFGLTAIACAMVCSTLRAQTGAVQANYATPRRIMVGLPQPATGQSGELFLQPNVMLAPSIPPPAPPVAPGFGSQPPVTAAMPPRRELTSSSLAAQPVSMPQMSSVMRNQPEAMPPPGAMMSEEVFPGEVIPESVAEGLPDEPFPMAAVEPVVPFPPVGSYVEPIALPLFDKMCRPDGPPTGDEDEDYNGIGRERVMFAPFEIDVTQPLNNFRLRFDAAYGWNYPDRAEYLWSRARVLGGKGPPLIERSVDYQDARILMEAPASETFSLQTELPIRFVNPEINQNTGGLGDMNIATKLVLIDGTHWQITQFFRTYINTGSSKAGLGSGHVSLEPGFLFRYKWDDITYLHSELKFWFPVGADPVYSGQVLNYGLGISHVLYDSDSWAVIPVLEWVGWSVIDGYQTPYPAGPPEHADPIDIGNLQPGVRIVRDNGGDLGLFEVGLSAAFGLTDSHWYNALIRLDFRWSY